MSDALGLNCVRVENAVFRAPCRNHSAVQRNALRRLRQTNSNTISDFPNYLQIGELISQHNPLEEMDCSRSAIRPLVIGWNVSQCAAMKDEARCC